jgi:FixJ family two-component response regulator
VPLPPFIACVDDDASVREALEGLLVAFGFAVEIFSSAENFLNFPGLDRISCLIADVKLGGISGIQLQRRLVESGRRIPTIVITAFGDDRLREQAFEAGAISFLHKPIARGDLLASIAQALKRAPDGDAIH